MEQKRVQYGWSKPADNLKDLGWNHFVYLVEGGYSVLYRIRTAFLESSLAARCRRSVRRWEGCGETRSEVSAVVQGSGLELDQGAGRRNGKRQVKRTCI